MVLVGGAKWKHQPTPYTFPKLLAFPTMPLSKNNPVTVEGVELGRFLFYDPILSRDSTISCANCHKQEAAFSDAGNIFSQGVKEHQPTRNSMPLFNLAWYEGFFWDGRAKTIEEQALHPIKAEMGTDWKTVTNRIENSDFYQSKFEAAFGDVLIDSVLITKAIAQFERTILSYQSRYDKALSLEITFTKDEYKGFEVANEHDKGNCMHCHTTDGNALGTTGRFSNNGLDEVQNVQDFKDIGLGEVTKISKDYGKFKIPSLRNIALTAPYMHDGRFQTLEEVLDFYNEDVKMSPTLDSKIFANHKGFAKLTEEEKRQIIVFLHTLTDSVLISNPAFSNPFLDETWILKNGN